MLLRKHFMLYPASDRKVQVPNTWTKYIMTTHPVVFITTVGQVRGKLIAGVAPFATCLDTSYEPPYVTFSAACRQHSVAGGPINRGRMNTYLNIRQNRMFIVNVPGRELLPQMDVVAIPYDRGAYLDKIDVAGLSKVSPHYLSRQKVHPPMIDECLAHLECEVVDIHRPAGSDHWNITGRVKTASYDQRLGDDLDQIRQALVTQTFHHFGSNSKAKSVRFIALSDRIEELQNTRIFHLETPERH